MEKVFLYDTNMVLKPANMPNQIPGFAVRIIRGNLLMVDSLVWELSDFDKVRSANGVKQWLLYFTT